MKKAQGDPVLSCEFMLAKTQTQPAFGVGRATQILHAE